MDRTRVSEALNSGSTPDKATSFSFCSRRLNSDLHCLKFISKQRQMTIE